MEEGFARRMVEVRSSALPVDYLTLDHYCIILGGLVSGCLVRHESSALS
jgi:hypothetical protein